MKLMRLINLIKLMSFDKPDKYTNELCMCVTELWLCLILTSWI